MGYSAVGALNYGNALGYAAVGDFGLNYGAVGAIAAPAALSYAMPQAVEVAAPVMQYAHVAPAPVQAVMHYAAPQIVDTQVHYEHRPVVTGYTSEVLKPALGAYVAPLDEPYVTREKIQAPVRTHSQITEQVTVQHPTKVNVEKVMYDVEVPTPVAQPYAVPITPQIDVHTVQHVAAPYAVPVAQPAPVMTYAVAEPIQVAAPAVTYAMPEPIQAAPLMMNYAAAPAVMNYAAAPLAAALPCAL